MVRLYASCKAVSAEISFGFERQLGVFVSFLRPEEPVHLITKPVYKRTQFIRGVVL